jgi:hypothetical protein
LNVGEDLDQHINDPQDANSILIGTPGLIYLLLLGRTTSVTNMQKALVGTIFSNSTQLQQTISKLLDSGERFLIQISAKRKSDPLSDDNDALYTANKAHLFSMLKAHHISFNTTEITSALTQLSAVNSHYPEYLLQQYPLTGPGGILNFPFRSLASHYFLYLAQILITVKSPLIPKVDIDSTRLSTIRTQWPNLPITLSTIAIKLLSDDEKKGSIEKQ